MRFSKLPAVIAAFAIALFSGPSQAANRALLVGVTAYRDQPLWGPRHDVALMYRLLRERGFAAEAVTVLADSLDDAALDAKQEHRYDSDLETRRKLAKIAGRPTRQAILDALERLASTAQPDDFIVIVLSGHGSQQPMGAVSANGVVEVDGLDDIFLPIDVGRWIDDKATVENAIIDDELGALVQRMRERGAFVWITVDACHSSNITRGPSDEYVATRAIDSVDLGVPLSLIAAARRPADDGLVVHEDKPRSGLLGGYVGFFAAWKNENAVDAPFPRMPPGSAVSVHGLLTYSIGQALEGHPALSYREIAQIVLARYHSYDSNPAGGRVAPTPFFEGDLDRIAFNPTVVTRGWIATSVPGQVNEFAITGGALSGLANGLEVAIRTPEQAEPIAQGHLIDVGVSGSRIALTKPLDPRFVGSTLFVEPPPPSIALAIRIALSLGLDSTDRDTEDFKIVRDALDKMIVSPYREITVDLVAPQDNPDVVLAVSGGQLWYLTEYASPPDSVAVKPTKSGTTIAGFAFRPNGRTPWGHARSPSLPIGSDAVKLSTQIEGRLVVIARYRNLLNVAGLLVGSPAGRDLKVDLHVLRHQEANPPRDSRAPFGRCLEYSYEVPETDQNVERITVGNAADLRHCDVVYVSLENLGSGKSIDLTLLYLDAERAISVLKAAEGGVTLLKGEKTVVPYRVVAWSARSQRPSAIGLERLVIIGVVRRDKEDQAVHLNYDWLAQPGISRDRSRTARSGSVAGFALERLLNDAAGSSLLSRRTSSGPLSDLENSFFIVQPWNMRAQQ